jgi:hypothetical protein
MLKKILPILVIAALVATILPQAGSQGPISVTTPVNLSYSGCVTGDASVKLGGTLSLDASSCGTGSGTVTSITAGTGLTGGTITTTGTIALDSPVALANGGTNQTTWTAGDCVQVNAGGTALESFGSACGGGSVSLTADSPLVVDPNPITGTGTVSCPTCATGADTTVYGGIIGGVLGSASGIIPFSSTATTSRTAFATDLFLSGPFFCLSSPSDNDWVAVALGTNTPSGTTITNGYIDSVASGLSASSCVGQNKQVFFTPSSTPISGVSNTLGSSSIQTYWSSAVLGSMTQPLSVRPNSTTGSSSTHYTSAGQGLTSSTTTSDEQLVQLPVANALDVSSMCLVTTTSQGAAGSLVITLRKNEVDTAMVVTVPLSGLSGRRCYSASTISFAAGDELSISMTNNHTSTSASIDNISLETTPTASGMTALLVFPKGNRILTASADRYSPMFVNDTLKTAENDAWSPLPRDGTIKNLRCYLKTAPAADATVTLYQNGSPTGLTVTLDHAGGGDRVISDTTHTVSASMYDGLSLDWTSAGGSVAVSSGCTAEFD